MRAALTEAKEALSQDEVPIGAVIVANGEKVPDTLIAAADSHSTPLFTSTLRSPELMDILSHFLAQAVAESVSLHGVFMEVQGFGALIKGDAAIGKSELALELISRGHRLRWSGLIWR